MSLELQGLKKPIGKPSEIALSRHHAHSTTGQPNRRAIAHNLSRRMHQGSHIESHSQICDKTLVECEETQYE